MEGVIMEFENIKKICSFSVSNWHLITMLAPYLSKELENGHQICTFFETDMEEMMEEFLSKLTLNQETKEQLLNLNWNNNQGYKYAQVQEELNKEPNKELLIVVNGNRNYIEKININIERWVKKNKIKSKISIINCYEVTQFNNHIKEILDGHHKILNTSGEKEIEEVFEGYTKNKQNVI